jgi:hypothetical protein
VQPAATTAAAAPVTSADAAAATAPFGAPGAAASPTVAAGASPAPELAAAAGAPVAKLPAVLVHKTPTCGCCHKWVDHLRAQGFRVDVRDHDDLVAVKQRLGVPMDKASCHTAEVGGYIVEGHVPAEDIKRLLAEKPKARGLFLPGMPLGSPGMEVPDGTVQPYTVELVQADGSTVAYAQHEPPAH